MSIMSDLLGVEDIKQLILREVSTKGFFDPSSFYANLTSLGVSFQQNYKDSFCELVKSRFTCAFCISKTCEFSKFAKKILEEFVNNAPYCIKKAYEKNILNIVASYYIKTKLQFKDVSILKCKYLWRLGLCNPDKCSKKGALEVPIPIAVF